MNRNSYAAKQTTHEWKIDQLEYKSACDTYTKCKDLQQQLSSMLTIFATVENKINNALGLCSKELALVYGYNKSLRDLNGNLGPSSHRDDPQLEEAFNHSGATFEVRFKVRTLSDTMVYPVVLKIDRVFELTAEALAVNIRNQCQRRREY